MERIILITGVSASGKTSLQNELIRQGWVRPVNFSTRRPRIDGAYDIDDEGDYSSNEMGEYVFINRSTFTTKLGNGDFLEATQYGGNLYGISDFLRNGKLLEKNICIIVDPVGRAQIMEKMIRLGIKIETYYIHITKELQEKRLSNRGDLEEEIIKRGRDFEWFHPTPTCIRLNGDQPTEDLASFIINRSV